jgi:hypothetical protein
MRRNRSLTHFQGLDQTIGLIQEVIAARSVYLSLISTKSTVVTWESFQLRQSVARARHRIAIKISSCKSSNSQPSRGLHWFTGTRSPQSHSEGLSPRNRPVILLLTTLGPVDSIQLLPAASLSICRRIIPAETLRIIVHLALHPTFICLYRISLS